MKRLISIALFLALAISLLTLPALAVVTNPNGKSIGGIEGTGDIDAYVIDAKASLGDKYLDVWGFAFSVTSSEALGFAGFVEYPEGERSDSRFFTFASTDLGNYETPYYQFLDIPLLGATGAKGEFKLVANNALFTAASAGKLAILELADVLLMMPSGVSIDSFSWLDKDGNTISASDANTTTGANPATGDSALIIAAIAVFGVSAGVAAFIFRKRKTEK